MIRSFKHKGLERFFSSGDTSGIRSDHKKRLRLILARLHAAKSPHDMNLPGLRLHALKGDMKGFYAVDISGNWRVVFRFRENEVYDVKYLDYH